MTVGPRLADDIVIRERIPTDDKAIRRLNDDAFGGTYESQLVADLRAEGLSAIELVSVDGTDVIGHILMSTLDVRVGDKCLCSLALAPMSVQPGRQRQGIGSALVREALRRARQQGWQAVIVVGRFSTGVLHLWHALADPSLLSANQILLDTIQHSDRVVSASGLSSLKSAGDAHPIWDADRRSKSRIAIG